MTIEQHGLVVEGDVPVATVQAHAARDVKKLVELQASDHTDVWRLARQLRAEWRQERYARLWPDKLPNCLKNYGRDALCDARSGAPPG